MPIVNQVHAVILPTELLAEIFLLCLPDVTHQPETHSYVVDQPRTLRRSEAPLLVASACKRWREVATSTPRLWLSLDLNRDLGPVSANTGVVSSWLSRSHPYPLSLVLNRHCPPRAVDEIKRHCERWGAVELRIHENDPRVFDDVRGRLPCLEKLYLCLEFEPPHVVESFADAHRLKQVFLEAGTTELGSVVLPWHQLTSLTCMYFSDIECVEILKKCPALVDCCLIGCSTDRSMELMKVFSPIVLRRITSLTLCEATVLDTLRSLELPSLRDLQLELGEDGDVEILVSFLTRSSCQLESICLWQVDDQDLLRCLPVLASPVTLEIRTCNQLLTDDFFRLLKDRTILPKLRELDIDVNLTNWPTRDWTDSLMRDMILSRCIGCENLSDHLEVFRLLYKPPEGEDAPELLAFASELDPLLSPQMLEFEISANSDHWV
ncbi:hypothetical protein MVEN_00762200 [Mycena venus]|uniref:F-box domain-containing protein n=1 Tax=Mycena venus TaxID=2733690 RepID=A0A8H7D5R3_9AGAR|nr:hypothetical protein MVEN_00762200 [Mycena venus]